MSPSMQYHVESYDFRGYENKDVKNFTVRLFLFRVVSLLSYVSVFSLHLIVL